MMITVWNNDHDDSVIAEKTPYHTKLPKSSEAYLIYREPLLFKQQSSNGWNRRGQWIMTVSPCKRQDVFLNMSTLSNSGLPLSDQIFLEFVKDRWFGRVL